jgi:hypothetical protein
MAEMTIFERLNRAPTKPEPQQPDHAQRMLDFVLRWPRPSISVPDLMTYGPEPRKNAEETLKLATILEKHGWLSKKDTPKKNMRHWTINRKPFVHPKLTTAK